MTFTIGITGAEQYLEGGGGRIKVLLLGMPSAGKTRSASFWPKPIFVDCEDGLMSVADRKVPYAQIRSYDDMKQMIQILELEAKKPKDKRRFETVVIDTIDAYQRIVIQEYLKSQRKAAMSGWQDWGYLDAKMQELLAALFLLPFNVVMNCHVKETKVGDDDSSVMVIVPKLKGDMREQIAGEFDFVGLVETGFEAINGKRQVARYIQWAPTPQAAFLKSRGGALPEKTPITFSSEDYLVIQRALAEGLKDLTPGEVLETVETTPVTAEPVLPGGPVGNGSGAKAAPAKKAAAAPAAPKAAPASAVPPPPVAAAAAPPAAPVPARDPNVQELPVTEQEAVANVEQILGGQVIEDEPQAAPALEPEQDTTTPVAEAPAAPEPAEEPAQVEQPVADASEVPHNGEITVPCGSPRYPGQVVRSEGCGIELQLDIQEGRVTRVISPEAQSPELIELGGLRERAFLCNGCYANARKNAKK